MSYTYDNDNQRTAGYASTVSGQSQVNSATSCTGGSGIGQPILVGLDNNGQ